MRQFMGLRSAKKASTAIGLRLALFTAVCVASIQVDTAFAKVRPDETASFENEIEAKLDPRILALHDRMSSVANILQHKQGSATVQQNSFDYLSAVDKKQVKLTDDSNPERILHARVTRIDGDQYVEINDVAQKQIYLFVGQPNEKFADSEKARKQLLDRSRGLMQYIYKQQVRAQRDVIIAWADNEGEIKNLDTFRKPEKNTFESFSRHLKAIAKRPGIGDAALGLTFGSLNAASVALASVIGHTIDPHTSASLAPAAVAFVVSFGFTTFSSSYRDFLRIFPGDAWNTGVSAVSYLAEAAVMLTLTQHAGDHTNTVHYIANSGEPLGQMLIHQTMQFLNNPWVRASINTLFTCWVGAQIKAHNQIRDILRVNSGSISWLGMNLKKSTIEYEGGKALVKFVRFLDLTGLSLSVPLGLPALPLGRAIFISLGVLGKMTRNAHLNLYKATSEDSFARMFREAQDEYEALATKEKSEPSQLDSQPPVHEYMHSGGSRAAAAKAGGCLKDTFLRTAS